VRGLLSYGAYVPHWRLQRSRIGEALGSPPGKGTRAVASFDEDTTSMGVEAARIALRSLPAREDGSPGAHIGVLFATATPAYLDKTNATAIHAALGLAPSAAAYDMVGSVRSGVGALRAGANAGGRQLVVLSDIRGGLPGGADERDGGDGAAAFLFGDTDDGDDVIAVLEGAGSATAEFLDRWRSPGDASSKQWEERFGEQVYAGLAETAVADALKNSGLTVTELDQVAVVGLHGRANRRVAASIGARPESYAPDLTAAIGNAGTAQPGLVIADILDRADANQTILVVVLADGADAFVLRTTASLADRRQAATSVATQIEAGSDDLPYPTFLTWRGMLDREPPRRPDPDRPAAPPSARREAWKFGFTGSQCEACSTVHLPPQRVCVKCHAVDQMKPRRMADTSATVATFTVDRLAFSLNPPVVAAVLDFDGGGRFTCELTDVDPSTVKIGDRVEMSFRRLFTAGGVHNYFWKARPSREASGGSQ
jgi:3-hydroxy-3-methylglutaryl CoA synthase/uncharacterized OB-fold protein